MQYVPIITDVVSSNPALTCDKVCQSRGRSVVFYGYSGFHHQ